MIKPENVVSPITLAFKREIKIIFDQIPLSKQPKYIVDIGCHDGKLLKDIYFIICNQTLRGEDLKNNPLMLIGVTPSQSALDKTKILLKNTPYFVLKSDTTNPEEILKILQEIEIKDSENIVFINSFLIDTSIDNSLRVSPSNLIKLGKNFLKKLLGKQTYCDFDDFNSINYMFRNWSNIFKSWNTVLKNNKFGLFVLISNSINSKQIDHYIEGSHPDKDIDPEMIIILGG